MAFTSVKRSGGDFNGRINFDAANVNLGASFNPESGEFTAPHSATYYFSLSAVTGTTKGQTSISVIKNGEILHINDANHHSGMNSLTYSWIESMNAGEKMFLMVTSNNLYADGENFVILNGFSLVLSLHLFFFFFLLFDIFLPFLRSIQNARNLHHWCFQE